MKQHDHAPESHSPLPDFLVTKEGDVITGAHALLQAWAKGGSGKSSEIAQQALLTYLAATELIDESEAAEITDDNKEQFHLLSEAILWALAAGIENASDPQGKALLARLGAIGGAKKHEKNRKHREEARARFAQLGGKVSKNQAAKRWAAEYGVEEKTVRGWLIESRKSGAS